MKKQFRKSVLVISLVSLFAGISDQVMAANTKGTATAEVMRAISMGPTPGGPGEPIAPGLLAFGTFAGAVGGTIDIDPSTCTLDSSIAHFGGHGCAKFSISGYDNAAYVINYDPNQTLTHAEVPAATMPYVLKLDDNDNRYRNLNGGSDEIQFGGSLTISPSSLLGVYSDIFTVTIDYQ